MSLRLIGACLAIGMVAAALFLSFPELDTVPTAWFYRPDYGFPVAQLPLLNALTPALKWLAVAFGLALIGLIAWPRLWPWAAPPRRRVLVYLLANLAIGPGVVANTVFKEHWDRARPSHTVEFGGDKSYSPPLAISDQCPTNCSFVSGDASVGFSTLAFALVAPRRRRAWLTGAIAAGGAIGLLRLAVGAHYLSDVVFAGVFMGLVAGVLHLILFPDRARVRRHAAETRE